MKNLNNYLYITDKTIQQLQLLNKVTVIFKYGKGRSVKHDINKRTECRLNLNKPHPGYEKTYFCETQKEYTMIENYVLNKLRNDDRYICIKTDTITQRNSEFFWIKEECTSKKQIDRLWFELSNTIEKLHYEFKTKEEGEENEIENEIESENEESIEIDSNSDDEETNDKVINFNDYDSKTMSLVGSKISGLLNSRKIHNWNHLNNIIASYVYEQCNKNLDDANSKLKITLHANNEIKQRLVKNIDYDFYHYGVNAEYAYKNAQYVQQLYNLNFDKLIITLS